MSKREKYIDKVVQWIIKNDIELNVLINKGTNGLIIEGYYVHKLFGVSYCDPTAHCTLLNWYHSPIHSVKQKYGVSNDEDLNAIRKKLQVYFQGCIDKGLIRVDE